jgi:hypothetical protein
MRASRFHLAAAVAVALAAGCGDGGTGPQPRVRLDFASLAGEWVLTSDVTGRVPCTVDHCAVVSGGKEYDRQQRRIRARVTVGAPAEQSAETENGGSFYTVSRHPANYLGTDSIYLLERNGSGRIVGQVKAINVSTSLTVQAQSTPGGAPTARVHVYLRPYSGPSTSYDASLQGEGSQPRRLVGSGPGDGPANVGAWTMERP